MAISPARSAAFDILLRVELRNAYASELLHSGRWEQLSRPWVGDGTGDGRPALAIALG